MQERLDRFLLQEFALDYDFHPIAALVSFLFCDPQFRNEFSLGSTSTCSPIVRAD